MAIPILGHGDIPTPSEVKRMADAGAREDAETESMREKAAQRFKLLRRYFLSCPQAPKSFRDRVTTGKWAAYDYDVRLCLLDGEEEDGEKWCAIEWHQDPELFPSIGKLPYPFYIHEDAEGKPLPLDMESPKGGNEFIRAVHEECYIRGGPFEAWRRVLAARAKKEQRRLQLKAERKERRREPLDRFTHELGRQEPHLAIHTPKIQVPG